MANGVQYRGIGDILTVFDNMKLMCWSLTYGKLMQCKYPSKQTATGNGTFAESRELLASMLRNLQNGESYAVYTLNLYEKAPAAGIKSSTEPDYSFNITLFSRDEYDGFNDRRPGTVKQRELEEEIRQLKLKVESKDSEYEEEDAPSGIMGFLNGIVEDDRFKAKIQDAFFNLADKLFNGKEPEAPIHSMNKQINQPAAVGAIEDQPVLIDGAQHEALQKAVDILIRVDPKLGDNMYKLANLASRDPGKYKNLVGMLNLMA